MRPNLATSTFSSSSAASPSAETLEHLKSISLLSDDDWLDLLKVSWYEYQKYKIGLRALPEKSISNISGYFKLNPSSIIDANIDFKKIELELSGYKPKISDRFLVAAYSRRRTTITTIEFIEKNYGWRLKTDLMKYFGFNQAALIDPFDSVSLQLLTEMCTYLRKRQFQPQDFFLMGAYSAQGNNNSILSKALATFTDLHELYYHFIYDMMSLFENNYEYSYEKLNAFECIVGVKSNYDIAHELGARLLGSPQLCSIKQGMAASLPSYIGLPYAKVIHTTCEHKGDDLCRFHVDFKPSLAKKFN